MHTPIPSKLNNPSSLSGSATPQSTSDQTWISTFRLIQVPLIKLLPIKLWGEQVWQRMINYWSNPPELQVWQRRDRAGHVHWHTFDPYTNQSASFGSEADVKAWIDDHLAQRQVASQGYGLGCASIDVSLHQASPFR